MSKDNTSLTKFDRRGNLMVGIHTASLDEVVKYFGGSKSLKRGKLAKNLKFFYNFVRYYAKAIYLDGSFTTSKLSPGDLDIIVVLPDEFRSNIPGQKRLIEFINSYAKLKLHIFAYFENDPKIQEMIDLFSSTRKNEDDVQFPKGIVSLEIRK